MRVRVRERSRFHLETVVPITAAHALDDIATDGERPRLPLFDDVAVLVEHQPRIFEEILSAAAQVNPAPAGSGDCAPVHPGE